MANLLNLKAKKMIMMDFCYATIDSLMNTINEVATLRVGYLCIY